MHCLLAFGPGASGDGMDRDHAGDRIASVSACQCGTTQTDALQRVRVRTNIRCPRSTSFPTRWPPCQTRQDQDPRSPRWIALASDHAGFALKEELKEVLAGRGHEEVREITERHLRPLPS
jgi:hypothetical protein